MPRSLVDAVKGCCAPKTAGALSAEDARALATMFKTLSDPTRVRLLSLVAAAAAGETCVCDLTTAIQLSQPTVSHHMKQLVDAGLVSREQRGKMAYYSLVPETLALLQGALSPESWLAHSARP